MESKNDTLVLINDLLVQFNAGKGRKINAVNNVNLEIKSQETFSIVGESGSGKTTIGRAVIGVQPVKGGTVYLNNRVVVGRATNLYLLNKVIQKSLKQMKINAANTSKYFQRYINEAKEFYFKIVKNKKLDILTGNLKDYKNKNFIIKNAEDLITKGIISENGDKTLNYVKVLQEQNLQKLIFIIRLQQKAIRFIDLLEKYSEEVSKELHEAVRAKAKKTHVLVRETKQSANKIYQSLLNIEKARQDLLERKNDSIEIFFNILFSNFEVIVDSQKTFVSDLEEIIDSQELNLALCAPENKRKKIIDKYNSLINLKRNETYNNLINIINDLKMNNKNNKDLQYFEKIVKGIWSHQTINFRALEKYFNELDMLVKNKSTNFSSLKVWTLAFKNSDLEEEVREYHKNYIEQNNYQISKITELRNKILHAKKIVDKNIIADREFIKIFSPYINKKIDLPEETINEYSELLEFLSLPSINQIASKMEMFKDTTRKERKNNKKEMQMIFQDPAASLNDRMAVEQIICEGIENYPEIYQSEEVRQSYLKWYNENYPDRQITIEDVKDQKVKRFLVLNLIKEVGLLPEHISRYPHEFSGGQRQRIGIARALIMKPKIIVADEPISALDVSIRAQVMNLLKKFKQELNLSYIFIAHDLSVVRFVSDRIAVIYRGDIVELAEANELFDNPLHPYTKSLLSAVPLPDPKQESLKIKFNYEPEIEHYDYLTDYPNFIEVKPGHFVLANQREEEKIKKGVK